MDFLIIIHKCYNMPDTGYTIHYTPEKDCKWCKKSKSLYYCDLNPQHRNLGKCKVCSFGHLR